MSKAIFFNFPTHGCINALLATVKELVQRGENIIYYCTDEFREKIEKTGAEFRPYNGLINELNLTHFDLFKVLKINIEMTADKMACLPDIVGREKPDYIVHDSLCTWGKHIAAMLKLPAVNLVHSYPISKSSVIFSSDMAWLLLKTGIYKLKNSLLKNHSLKILNRKYNINLSMADIFINTENLNIIYTSRYLAADFYQSDKNYQFVGPSLFFKDDENDFPYSTLKEKKVIYISLGTLLGNNQRFFKTCIKAFSNKPFCVVISTGHFIDQADLGTIPDNFIIRKSVPQQQLLRHIDLFITHAGMNSVNEAIFFGAPMLLLPHTIEQKMIAAQVEQLGLGKIINIKRLTSYKLYRDTVRLMEDNHKKNQSVKYKTLFRDEEKVSHIKAANAILDYKKKIITQVQ